MKTFYDTVRALLDWAAEPDALVLSLYLDVSAGHDHKAFDFAEASCEALLGALDSGSDAERAFDALVRRALSGLEAEIEGARQADYDGLCLFLSDEPALDERVRLRFAFHNQAETGRAPFLRQLLYYSEEYEQAVAVVIDESHGALSIDLCELHVGDARSCHRVKPTHGRTVGEELSALLHKQIHDQPYLHVILLGEEAPRRRIEAALDRAVAERIIDRIASPIAPSDPRFLRAIHRSLQAYERRSEAEGVARLAPMRASGEPVALGLGETLDAINHGRIHTLYILQSFAGRGWLCDVCDSMGALPAPPACTACGASVSTVPLEEHMLDQAAACGAEIETVFESEPLAKVGGVAALLHDGATPPPGVIQP